MELKERNKSEVVLELISLSIGLVAMWLMVLNGLFKDIILYVEYIAVVASALVLVKMYGMTKKMPSGLILWTEIRKKYQSRFALETTMLSFLSSYAILNNIV